MGTWTDSYAMDVTNDIHTDQTHVPWFGPKRQPVPLLWFRGAMQDKKRAHNNSQGGMRPPWDQHGIQVETELFATARRSKHTPTSPHTHRTHHHQPPQTTPTATLPTLQAITWAALWCGAVTCAYTVWAQSFGQRSVTATDANLIYSSQPIWSTAIAFVFLGETFSPVGGVGALIIMAAIALAINAERLQTETGADG